MHNVQDMTLDGIVWKSGSPEVRCLHKTTALGLFIHWVTGLFQRQFGDFRTSGLPDFRTIACRMIAVIARLCPLARWR